MSSRVEGRGLCGIGPRLSAAQSAPLYAQRTPAIVRARVGSTLRMRACGWGERTMAAYACPFRLKSSLNRPDPVSRGTSSLRGNACPIAPAATRSGPLRSFTAGLPSLGTEVLPEKIDRAGERLVRFGFAVRLAAVARKSMVRARVLVDRHQRIRRKPALEQLVHLGLHPAVLHRHMQHKRPVQVLRFADVVLYIRTVIGHGAVDVGAAAQEVAELAAQAIADRADLAIAFFHSAEEFRGVLHVANAEVVVEVVIQIEGLLH